MTFLGLFTLLASVLYLVSDVIEALQGGFSAGQLWLTLLAEAAIPIFVIGLACATSAPGTSRCVRDLGLAGMGAAMLRAPGARPQA